jgi:DNA-binding CsgD family transcriptional regulator
MPLTKRQLLVVQAIADGDTLDEIGSRLFIARSSVAKLAEAARYKLRASNTPNLILRAAAMGLLEMPEVETNDSVAVIVPQIQGHGLKHEGAAFEWVEGLTGLELDRVHSNTVSGVGRAWCACGESSGILQSSTQRRSWHRDHKAAILAEREGGSESASPPQGVVTESAQPEPELTQEQVIKKLREITGQDEVSQLIRELSSPTPPQADPRDVVVRLSRAGAVVLATWILGDYPDGLRFSWFSIDRTPTGVLIRTRPRPFNQPPTD